MVAHVIDALDYGSCDAFVCAARAALELYSPPLAAHSERVASLTVALAEAVGAVGTGALRGLHFDPDQINAIRYAGLLHDVGQIGVPPRLLLKGKKLKASEQVSIRQRFAYLKRTREVEHLRAQIRHFRAGDASESVLSEMDRTHGEEQERLEQLLETVLRANEPGAADSDLAALGDISRLRCPGIDGAQEPLLSEQELAALSAARGSLSDEERLQVQKHVTYSFVLLSRFPWQGACARVPEIAYAHHEKMDGSGYPRGLSGAEIPVESRMMAIADILDALVAWDATFIRPVSLERALDTLILEARQGRLDGDLLRLFIDEKVYARTNVKRA
jgi:response regulator RpfG family c-di-GMP phosphodiesterase